MGANKICPIMSEITTHKNRYGGEVSELCEESCRQERCAWWDEEAKKCAMYALHDIADIMWGEN